MLETVCPFKNSLFDFDQFILVGADAELYSVLDGAVPVCGRPDVCEMIVVRMFTFIQHASGQNGLAVCSIRAGHIQGHRIKVSEHSHNRTDGGIIFPMAVAVRGNVNDQTDVEIGPSADDCFGIFGNLAV